MYPDDELETEEPPEWPEPDYDEYEYPVEEEPPGPSPAAAVAWRVGAAGVAFCAFTQLQNYFLYAPREDVSTLSDALFLLRFPFLQFEYVLAALILAGLYLLTAERGPAQILFWASWFAHHAILIVDQLCYKLFTNHLKWTLVNAELSEAPLIASELWSSAVVELGWWSALNAALLLLLSGWLWRLHHRRHREPEPLWQPEPWEWRLPLFSVYTAIGTVLMVTTVKHNLNLDHHPLATLVVSLFHTDDAPQPYSQLVVTKLYRPQHGSHVDPDGQLEALVSARAAIRGRERKPNLVIYIMESVGTLQLFSLDGGLNPEITPTIAELAQRSVTFDSVYPSFPSTARSHIPMLTGGPTITWGGYTHYFDYPYSAANVISELNARGYHTGVFSTGDLAYERIGEFYRDLGPDKLCYYNDQAQSMSDKAKINSWGVHSDEVRRVAIDWVRDEVPKDKPFAMIFLTLATHHPYTYPVTHHAPLGASTLQDKYFNAMHYTDAVLARLREDLAELERLDDTVLVITGDHGEAFGLRHSGNHVHRNFLYEENVRTFIMVCDPTLEGRIVSQRIGQIGDLGPTVVSLLDDSPIAMPGQNLFNRNYRLRTVYFHKVTDPYRWGLRDGRWKFVSGRGTESPQLFDLETDPGEKKNLALDKPEMVRLYGELCATWYTKTGYDYISALKGYELPADKRFLRRQLGRRPPPGARVLTFGRVGQGSGDINDVALATPAAFAPGDEVFFRVDWSPWPTKQKIQYIIEDPAGEELQPYAWLLEANAVRSTKSLLPPLKAPLQRGVYTVHFWLGARKLITGTFEVR